MAFTKQEWGYILCDWTKSCFTVIIASFIFPILYGILTADVFSAESLYGLIVSAISLAITVMSPVPGTNADYHRYKKWFILYFFTLGIVFTVFLGFFSEDSALWRIIPIPCVLASIGCAGTNAFYDSFIVDVTSDDHMDRVSRTGYAFEYIGGSMIPLVLAINLLQVVPVLAIDGELCIGTMRIPYTIFTGFRITIFMTGLWWLLFVIPLHNFVDQRHGIDPEPHAVKNAFIRLGKTMGNIRAHTHAFLFLAAYLLSIDGVHTLISMAVPFASNAIEEITPHDTTAVLLPILLAIRVTVIVFALFVSGAVVFGLISRGATAFYHQPENHRPMGRAPQIQAKIRQAMHLCSPSRPNTTVPARFERTGAPG